jgi:hypothetical protein
MTNEMHKLNDAQRKSLRALFAGRSAISVFVNDVTDLVTVDFGPVTHFVVLGPRGRVADHTFGPSYN